MVLTDTVQILCPIQPNKKSKAQGPKRWLRRQRCLPSSFKTWMSSRTQVSKGEKQFLQVVFHLPHPHSGTCVHIQWINNFNKHKKNNYLCCQDMKGQKLVGLLLKWESVRWTFLCFNREAIITRIESIVGRKLTTQEMHNHFCNVHTLR